MHSENKGEVVLTIIVPIYQEAGIIADSIYRLHRVADELGYDYEILIADDGSTDESDVIVSNLITSFDHLRFFRYPHNKGRGFILSRAVEQSRGGIICYIDADLQIDPEVLPRLVSRIENGSDIVIGAKHHPNSKLYYSRWRRLQSIIYNTLARFILGVCVSDFQCGAKAFRRSAIHDLIKHTTCRGWSWDTELILKADKLGLRLTEVPVIVRPTPDRASHVRLFSAFIMGWHLIRLWSWLKFGDKSFMKKTIIEEDME
jgi:glycosyltransferase involved in cell wall biosynthesis